jgi:hypothetical protein
MVQGRTGLEKESAAMPGNGWKASRVALPKHSHSTALRLLCFGMLIALAGNIYQFVQSERMARDLGVLQLNVQNQFAEIRELQSGALEQNVRRFDELNKQFAGIKAATRSEVRKLLGDE